MWAKKKTYCKKCGSVHVISEPCYVGQTNPVYQENGVTYDTRPQYPDRNEDDKHLTEPMGPGYPEIVQRTSQMESYLRIIADPADFQTGRSTQDEWSRRLVPSSWVDIPDELPPDPRPTFLGSFGEADCVTSWPIPISNEDLDATRGIVATKPSFGKEDEGPSYAFFLI